MSEIRANTISDAAGTGPVTLTKQSAAKVRCEASYSAGIPTSTNSLNVSSLTDTAVGALTYNLTNSFASTSVTQTASAQFNSTTGTCFAMFNKSARTTSTLRQDHYQAGVVSDPEAMAMTAHGDLA